jgi:hypothetical protein
VSSVPANRGGAVDGSSPSEACGGGGGGGGGGARRRGLGLVKECGQNSCPMERLLYA